MVQEKLQYVWLNLGKQVCATDISKDMLEVAKYKCIDFKADVMLSRVDMCDFAVDTKLDLIFMFMWFFKLCNKILKRC